jgi:hypothetical protein
MPPVVADVAKARGIEGAKTHWGSITLSAKVISIVIWGNTLNRFI